MSATLDFRNTNALWGSVLVETLVRVGVREAVVSPGSRSTPLTIAFARHPGIEAIPVLDERSAAFLALGLAKQHHRPVVLLCTSGTAGANYFPAIIEAQESGTPLLVITADRPPEMRDCASGQTIDQQKLFGSHVNFYHELAVPEASLAMLGYLRQTMAHAVTRARLPAPGPVHLNAPFRDPLPPLADESTRELAGKIDEAFFLHLGQPAPVASTTVNWTLSPARRGVIVAGPAAPADAAGYAASVAALAKKLGWPLLADALSPVRSRVPAASVVSCYDAILREPTLARSLAPEFVLCLGGWPTSKILRGWLETSEAEVLLVSPGAANRDALHGRARQLTAAVESFVVSGAEQGDLEYREQWLRAEHRARAEIDERLEQETGLFEPKACWLLARHLPERTPVFVASSMPVRDVEYFWPANERAHAVWFNRGANGIDGTLSTALGVAHGGAPAVLLTGDLALLHDANGFLLRPKFRGSLTIVLINNRGGGIFEHLPVAQFEPPFEEFFATPQEVDFAQLCAAHGVDHVAVRDWPHFVGLIADLPERGLRVLELRTDRKRDAVRRKALLASAGAAASG